MIKASRAQIGKIHQLKSRLGLEDGDYRAQLVLVTGKDSAAKLSTSEADAMIKSLQGSNSLNDKVELQGPYVAICRALWISGYHLGLFDSRSDRAMLAFVKRQTQIDHLNWVRDPVDGSKVIEGLKAILKREAGVIWPTGKADTPEGRKLAVLNAQMRLLEVPEDCISAAPIDQQIALFGGNLRDRKHGVVPNSATLTCQPRSAI